MGQLVIFTEAADWHTRQLKRACRKRGAEVSVLSLQDAAFKLGQGGTGVSLPGFEDTLPRAVFVRVVAAGSFEQVTLRLGVLHALKLLGVPVINDARAIERCVDKAMTSFLLHHAGLPTPPTFVTGQMPSATQHVAAAHGDTIAKPLFGAQGRHLRRLAPGDAVPDLPGYAGVYYLQAMVEQHQGHHEDYRVLVVGDKAVAAMRRHSDHWVTNVAKGGQCESVAPDGELAELAVAAAKAVGADYAGVDLIADAKGVLSVLEVNSMPAWKGLQSVTDFNIAERLIDFALSRDAA
jgi:RimK family alpha-L-glutamate ligase